MNKDKTMQSNRLKLLEMNRHCFFNYDVDFDYNEDGEVNQADLTLLNAKFSGVDGLLMNFMAGIADKGALNEFSKTFESRQYYMPTQTGYTVYDKYGKASEVYNKMDVPIVTAAGETIEGILTQKYVYNERGFMTRSESYGIDMDEY